MAISNIINKKQKCLYLGNLNALRAGVMQKIMWKVCGKYLIIKPDDFVISTGKTFSVRKFVEMSFK